MKRSVLASAFLSCVVFSCLTAPLAVLGSNLITIELQKENIFVGRLKDVATPYLGLAGLISLGAGAVSFSVSEWRRSARKSNLVETQLVELQNELKEKSSQIDDLQLSDSYLAANGLEIFLQQNGKQPVPMSEEVVEKVTEKVAPAELSHVAQLVPSPARRMTSSLPVEKKLQSQPYHGIVETPTVERSKAHSVMERKSESLPVVPEVMTHLSDLQNQIKQMEAYIEALQSSLQPLVPTYETTDPYNLEIQRLHRRLQLLELDWIRHQNAS
ncbi:MAG: hypothetical protein NW220_08165 [Leptolyngbyaceae cyanobacterium bins.349]|nr:hypothetical protein [Leptolyngbyaceae cyanobacterium bins.349]